MRFVPYQGVECNDSMHRAAWNSLSDSVSDSLSDSVSDDVLYYAC